MKKEEKKGEEKKMIDLSKVKVPNIDGTESTMDVAKDVAGLTYGRTQNLETVSACLDLFKTGRCEWSETVRDDLSLTVNSLCRVINGEQIPMGIVVKNAILEALK